jgi:hypothetical protein
VSESRDPSGDSNPRFNKHTGSQSSSARADSNSRCQRVDTEPKRNEHLDNEIPQGRGDSNSRPQRVYTGPQTQYNSLSESQECHEGEVSVSRTHTHTQAQSPSYVPSTFHSQYHHPDTPEHTRAAPHRADSGSETRKVNSDSETRKLNSESGKRMMHSGSGNANSNSESDNIAVDLLSGDDQRGRKEQTQKRNKIVSAKNTADQEKLVRQCMYVCMYVYMYV